MFSWQCQIPIIKIVNLAEDVEQNFTNTWRLSNKFYGVSITLLQNLTGISKIKFETEKILPQQSLIRFTSGQEKARKSLWLVIWHLKHWTSRPQCPLIRLIVLNPIGIQVTSVAWIHQIFQIMRLSLT